MSTKPYNVKYNVDVVCVQCDVVFLNNTTSERIFCDVCSSSKCSVCGIVFSEKYTCRICHARHGAPSDDCQRCQDCFSHNRIKYRKPINI